MLILLVFKVTKIKHYDPKPFSQQEQKLSGLNDNDKRQSVVFVSGLTIIMATIAAVLSNGIINYLFKV